MVLPNIITNFANELIKSNIMKNNFDTAVAKMRSLMERVEKPHTHYEACLNEEKYLNEMAKIKPRFEKKAEDVFDILDQIANGQFVSIGYVTAANLEIPKVKRKNPETNRTKSYPDYERFASELGVESSVGGVIKITNYHLNYHHRQGVKKAYSQWKKDANDIRVAYGLKPIGTKDAYSETANYGNGIEVYNGKNNALQGHFYAPQNTHGANIKSSYYLVDPEGHIVKYAGKDAQEVLRTLTDEEIKRYRKAKKEPSDEKKLREMGREEEVIQAFRQAMADLKMNYKNFEGNKILYICATVQGQAIVYINQNLASAVSDINIVPQEFMDLAYKQYEKELELTREKNQDM